MPSPAHRRRSAAGNELQRRQRRPGLAQGRSPQRSADASRPRRLRRACRRAPAARTRLRDVSRTLRQHPGRRPPQPRRQQRRPHLRRRRPSARRASSSPPAPMSGISVVSPSPTRSASRWLHRPTTAPDSAPGSPGCRRARSMPVTEFPTCPACTGSRTGPCNWWAGKTWHRRNPGDRSRTVPRTCSFRSSTTRTATIPEHRPRCGPERPVPAYLIRRRTVARATTGPAPHESPWARATTQRLVDGSGRLVQQLRQQLPVLLLRSAVRLRNREVTATCVHGRVLLQGRHRSHLPTPSRRRPPRALRDRRSHREPSNCRHLPVLRAHARHPLP